MKFNRYFQKVLNVVIENVIDGFRLSIMVTGLVAIENVIDEQIKNTCRILIDKSDLRTGTLVFNTSIKHPPYWL